MAPTVLRAGIEENVLLEAFGLSEPVDVKIAVYKYPLRTPRQLFQGNVTLNSHNNYSVLTAITVIRNHFLSRFAFFFFSLKEVVIYVIIFKWISK